MGAHSYFHIVCFFGVDLAQFSVLANGNDLIFPRVLESGVSALSRMVQILNKLGRCSQKRACWQKIGVVISQWLKLAPKRTSI